MKKQYLLLTILLLFTACTNQAEKKTEILSLVFEEVGSPFPSDSVICKFIPLETISSNLIGNIDQITISNGRIYVLDILSSKKILVFSMDGKFVASVGNHGGGPGEYISPRRFFIDEKRRTITVADTRTCHLISYNLDTYKYISKQKVFNFTDCIQLPKGSIAWYSMSGFETDKRELYNIKITNEELTQEEYYNAANFSSHYSYGLGSVFNQFENQTFVHFGQDATIWNVTDTKTKPVYHISFGNQKLPSSEWLQKESEGNENYTENLISSNYVSAYCVQKNSTHIMSIYIADNQVYIGLHDKKTNKAKKYLLNDFCEYADLRHMKNIIGVYNDYFVTYLTI